MSEQNPRAQRPAHGGADDEALGKKLKKLTVACSRADDAKAMRRHCEGRKKTGMASAWRQCGGNGGVVAPVVFICF